MSSKANIEPVPTSDRSGVAAEDNNTAVEVAKATGEDIEGPMNSKPAAILVAVALSFQVFVEGVGLGSETEIEDGFKKAISLLINVTTVSLSLGSAFTKANFTTRQMLIGLTLFTLVAPIALLIGMGLFDEDPDEGGMHTIINVLLLSTATGMYIYFACSEVLQKEFHDHPGAMGVVSRVIAMLIGVLIILGLVFIESGHSH